MEEFKKKHGIDELEDKLVGSILQNRYVVKKYLAHGSNGIVYTVKDLMKPDARLVIKLT